MEDHYISFNIKDYENDDIMMMSDVGEMIRILVKNGYDCLFRYDDCGIYVLEYQSRNYSLGADRFLTVTADEEEMILDMRYNKGEDV